MIHLFICWVIISWFASLRKIVNHPDPITYAEVVLALFIGWFMVPVVILSNLMERKI